MEEMYNRQIDFQRTMCTDYETQYLALLAEVGEFIDSTGFADWKVNPRDEENMIIELMDICIFAMNCNHYLGRAFVTPEDPQWQQYNDYRLVQDIVGSVVRTNFLDILPLVFRVYPEVEQKLIGKQALNRFRQDHGYKEGTYNKLWDGTEDNVYMLETLEECTSFDAIYAALATKYEKYS